MTDTSYGAKDITVLEGLEAVRRRPSMYIGSTGPRGLHHLVWEVVDNSVDEAMAGHCTRIEVTLGADGSVRVSDNGRGIPVDRHSKTKEPALTTVLTTLHAGGKFEQGAYTVSGGLHGVGVSAVNALSSRLDVEVRREGHVWTQSFQRGRAVGKVERGKPVKRTGTTVTFWPDPQVFTETTSFNYDTVATRLREMAFLNRGLEITLADRREEPRTDTFLYRGGLVDFVKHLNSPREPTHPHIIDLSDASEEAELELGMQWTDSYTESVLSFANNINTHEGGTHEEGFRKALTNAVNQFARSKGLLREKDENLTGEDIREGLTAVLSVRVRQPQFEGQTKTKLGNTEIRSYVERALNRMLPEWLDRYSAEARRIVEKCMTAAKAREAARKARELTRRKTALES
ncbi:MAG: ATP-binding protein, partial [Acidimicrobiia bacterium]